MIRIKWFGHAAFSVNIDGRIFYVDPWIKNPLNPERGFRRKLQTT